MSRVDVDGEGKLYFNDIEVELLKYTKHLDKNNEFYEQNVIARNKDTGKIKWVVQKNPKDMFVSIIKENNLLYGHTYYGSYCSIDLETGVATDLWVTK